MFAARKPFLVLPIAAALAVAIARPTSAQKYQFVSFDPPGSIFTATFGLNNNGLIAMQYIDAADVNHAAALQDGAFTVLDVPGALGTLAGGPSMSGRVPLGYSFDVNPDGSLAFIHSAVYFHGGYSFLPDAPGQTSTSPSGMNAGAVIVGAAWNDLDFTGIHGYIWDGSSYTVFDHPDTDIAYTVPFGVNNSGQVVGEYDTSDGVFHGFLLTRGKFTEIAVPGAINTIAYGINNSGVICGRYFANGARHGFLLSRGAYTTVDYPGALSTWLTGVNDRGDLCGFYVDANGDVHGFVATR